MNILHDVMYYIFYMWDSPYRFVHGFALVALIPLLINCFCGQKLLKYTMPLGCIYTGWVIGKALGLVGMGEICLIAGVLLGVLGGILAFKKPKAKMFIHFWMLGALAVAAIVDVVMNYKYVPEWLVCMPFILGLIPGILAFRVKDKRYPMMATAGLGGFCAGVELCFMMGMRPFALIIIIGLFIAGAGIFVQHTLSQNSSADAQTRPSKSSNARQRGLTQKVQRAGITTGARETSQVSRQELYKATPNLYCQNSGILIERFTLSKDAAGKVYIDIHFRNLGDSIIAVFFDVVGYDMADQPLGKHQYSTIDILVNNGEAFSSGMIELFDSAIRKADVIITQVVNSNYEVRKFEESDMIELSKASSST